MRTAAITLLGGAGLFLSFLPPSSGPADTFGDWFLRFYLAGMVASTILGHMQTFVLPDITPATAQKLQSKLESVGGLQVTGQLPVLTVTGYGVTAEAHYDGENSILVKVISKPWLVPESLIESKVTDAVNAARA